METGQKSLSSTDSLILSTPKGYGKVYVNLQKLVVSVMSKLDNADGISVHDSVVRPDDTCFTENDSKLLGNVSSSQHAKHSPEIINEHLFWEAHIEHYNNTSSLMNTNSETGELETSEILNLDSELKGTSHVYESRDTKLDSSQTVICLILNLSLKKCSGECAESALCSHLKCVMSIVT
jgi:hypothetical protein